ncbi:ABC transporter substrate-binding protein [Streptomyces winkii]|uniref:ABC transporter substrate-binding protein n=1 Tax=Streptomyces winkii TaxID=3051178 RepID=UPI0028D72D9D|nr:extracellular solute-binding protein [Streptomyces sp. DSM 40971]
MRARPIARRCLSACLCTVLALAVTACGGATAEKSDGTFTILQYEDQTSAQAQGWKKAVAIFKKRHPDVKVKFQTTSFDAMRQNAKITLSGNDVPDVIEFNKGNADAGQLASQGLLQPLTEEAKARGWDKKVTGPMAAFAKYDQNGLAGSGDWYGVPDIGEYVTFYYNKKTFADVGITKPPKTLAQLEAGMDKLKAAGHVPISSSANTSQGFNQMWLWYSLVSASASRRQIDDFMFLKGNVNFQSGPWKEGTRKFQDWIDKGYVGDKLGGLSYEQAIVNFLRGDGAMLMWNQSQFSRIRKDADFSWGYFTLPGAKQVMGSSGHLWGVPAKSNDKDLAYDWIDITLGDEVQNHTGDEGGLPLAGDASAIKDPVTRQYTERFDDLVEQNAMSFYPDYPVPGFLDFIQNHMQAMSNKSETADEYLKALQKFYDDGKKTATQQ